jgi:glucosyl-3-phosphoglycerate synthase
MQDVTERWFARRTSSAPDWPLGAVLEAKYAQDLTISVVIPARDEAATVGDVVGRIRAELIDRVPLVDELIVMDSLSSDATADRARAEGATVHSVGDVAPETGAMRGKGEALWKSLFVSRGDLLVFIDADLTDWGPHFVTGLLGPMLDDPQTLLVKGFYDRLVDGELGTHGGRVTELVARPLISLRWPELAAIVQPLAGEWAIRRSLFERLTVPIGYGVEFATTVDTWSRHGLDAIAQVDLGRRAHRHQSVHDLGVMAGEILRVADERSGLSTPDPLELSQFDRSVESHWVHRGIPVLERPPARTVAGYGADRAA